MNFVFGGVGTPDRIWKNGAEHRGRVIEPSDAEIIVEENGLTSSVQVRKTGDTRSMRLRRMDIPTCNNEDDSKSKPRPVKRPFNKGKEDCWKAKTACTVAAGADHATVDELLLAGL
jgi:hypothetical protein